MPELFVVAGPNGAGKTTLFKKIIPQGVEYINADAIAKTIREKAGGLNVQDIANRETSEIFSTKIKRGETFSIETNLADAETYKSFLALKALGYRINLVFLSVDNVNVCVARVAQRVAQGGHNVNPDVVKARYEIGLKLLAHYKNEIDRLTILDNSAGEFSVQAKLENGKVTYQATNMRSWARAIVESEQPKKSVSPQTVSDVRRQYEQKKKSK